MPDNNSGFFSNMYHTFIKNDIETVHNKVLNDVVVPYVQNLVLDLTNTALRTFFGNNNIPSIISRPVIGGTLTTQQSSVAGRFPVPIANRTGNVRDFNPANYPVSSQQEAEMIWLDLAEDIKKYGKAKLAAFYESRPIGITPETMAFEYGWYNVDGVKPVAVNNGWILNLPMPVPLNRN